MNILYLPDNITPTYIDFGNNNIFHNVNKLGLITYYTTIKSDNMYYLIYAMPHFELIDIKYSSQYSSNIEDYTHNIKMNMTNINDLIKIIPNILYVIIELIKYVNLLFIQLYIPNDSIRYNIYKSLQTTNIVTYLLDNNIQVIKEQDKYIYFNNYNAND